MTQAELNREVARATGEAEEAIDQLGFVQLTGVPFELDNIVDWDRLDEDRVALFG